MHRRTDRQIEITNPLQLYVKVLIEDMLYNKHDKLFQFRGFLKLFTGTRAGRPTNRPTNRNHTHFSINMKEFKKKAALFVFLFFMAEKYLKRAGKFLQKIK